ncbi:MAG: isoaspartyl peptidase/L-asparaginase [Thermomonas sp.]|nr:isoaspartyl peptidase/L-asparaginase [Thermomonas sp.]MBP7159045.1 isoaspartyl peptidase/L-asparaginase [Thermomonas sp.]MBP7789645.1 isoaspartyl peptidase/L-asparaginase [Thermomonas sp.]MBP8648975.1 isoaspartyl peptidase/L-asparaginase [Thermomonas sp.]MBP9696658.1 isoaspartyl peptidase/L-asparaginase [Thermomonas sp.]
MPLLAADTGRYLLGDTTAATPGKTAPGLLLMGGGDRNFEALRWFMKKAGNGHIVVLRASQAGEIGEEFFNEVGGIRSVETFVFNDREASTDPRILAALKRADGIFLAGGDQSRYVRFWRGTPVAEALDAHVRAGKPLGGTSAGLAMLGEYLYGAMDGGSQTSPRALADPLGAENTIETGFLRIALLKGVVTDTHFSERNRLGRLIAFVAKGEAMAGRPLIGLGVDEDAAVAVEGDGSARVYATSPMAGATVVRGGLAKQVEDEAMQLERVETIGAGPNSVLHLPDGRVERPVFQRRYAVRDGVLAALDAPLLVIHGGAGVEPGDLTREEEQAARAALEAALRAGHARLKAGGSSVDAVAATITVLEDAPQFNAGRGAVFTHDGRNELDTSIMDGATGKAGAAAGLHRVKNPITLARAIMDRSRHVMMVGEGAETFAQEQGVALVDPSYFRTEKRWQQLQKALQEESTAKEVGARLVLAGKAYFGTVGALALDAQGRLAAGTSTGGMTNKRYGRVGDAPILGAGTWADARCAVSGTGWGEFYIRAAAAHEICARVRLAGQGIVRASEGVINGDIPKAGGDGGAIALDAQGVAAFPFNTGGMYRGWIGADGVPHVAIYRDDALPLPAY